MGIEIKVTSADGAKRLQAALKVLSTRQAEVGWYENSHYPTGESVATIGLQNELGNPAKRIPPRPFLRPTIIKKQGEWVQFVRHSFKLILKGESTGEQLLGGLGQLASGDVRRTIADLKEPPLSPVTIQRRLEKRKNGKVIGQLDKPLVESGLFIQSLNDRVTDQ